MHRTHIKVDRAHIKVYRAHKNFLGKNFEKSPFFGVPTHKKSDWTHKKIAQNTQKFGPNT